MRQEHPEPERTAHTTVSLAKRPDFALASAVVRPSLRLVEGPAGKVKGEPRVIQVLIALADARGQVLSREDLLQQCWGGRIVGVDAVNRAVAEVRRIVDAAEAGFQVETVPRVGYRLSGIDWNNQPEPSAPDVRMSLLGRRRLVVGAAAVIATAGAGLAAFLGRQGRSEVDELIERGRLVQASGGPGNDQKAAIWFRQAIGRDPRRADAWGWLAVVLAEPGRAREAAHRALALDPKEPNARTLLAFQRRDLDAWTQWEDALLGVLADAPDCAAALSHLTLFYQGMGRCSDSWLTNERAISIEPFNPGHQSRRALKHWIFGRVGDADKVADHALQLWPRDSIVWNARMLTYAFTNRASAAIALLDDVGSRPANLTPPSIASWRAALQAIGTGSPLDVRRAVETCTAAASLAPGLAANAIMTFSHIGEVDAAFRVAEGLFEGRGTVVQRQRGSGLKDLYSGSTWGRTQFLFIPATAAFRADGRFSELCQKLGHVAYWRRRKIWPDDFVRGAIDPAQLT